MSARRVAMGAALAGAAWLAFFADKTPDSEVALPADRAARAAPANREAAAAAAVEPRDRRNGSSATPGPEATVNILSLRERQPFRPAANAAERVSPLFAASSWDPPPAKPVVVPPAPPQAPALPYTYMGKKFEDGAWEVYLGLGDDIRVVRTQTTLDARYRVESITPPTLKLTYLPLGQVQTLSIGMSE